MHHQPVQLRAENPHGTTPLAARPGQRSYPAGPGQVALTARSRPVRRARGGTGSRRHDLAVTASCRTRATWRMSSRWSLRPVRTQPGDHAARSPRPAGDQQRNGTLPGIPARDGYAPNLCRRISPATGVLVVEVLAWCSSPVSVAGFSVMASAGSVPWACSARSARPNATCACHDHAAWPSAWPPRWPGVAWLRRLVGLRADAAAGHRHVIDAANLPWWAFAIGWCSRSRRRCWRPAAG